MSYGERFRQYRLRQKLSQDALAEQARVTTTAISKIEHDTRHVTLEEAVRFAKIFQVSLEELAGLPLLIHPAVDPIKMVEGVAMVLWSQSDALNTKAFAAHVAYEMRRLAGVIDSFQWPVLA